MLCDPVSEFEPAARLLDPLPVLLFAPALLFEPLPVFEPPCLLFDPVPEYWMKLGVGAILSAFGVFWFAEGLGATWPGDAISLFPILALFLGTSWLLVGMLRTILLNGAEVEARSV